jgi:hypothetical protein
MKDDEREMSESIQCEEIKAGIQDDHQEPERRQLRVIFTPILSTFITATST